MESYKDAARVFEPKWRDEWFKNQVFHAPNPDEEGFDRFAPKFVVLDFFPYPSGIGLHVGHPLGYIATDILSRHLRMSGYNVLHSMGFDSFGLPAEQYAVQTGQHPELTTRENTSNMLAQLRNLGLDHDEHRRFSTTDPDYYKWTQWIFLRLFESYYDRNCVWKDRNGREVKGRARPIHELNERLCSGTWRTDSTGIAGPAEDPRFVNAVAPSGLRKVLDSHRLAVLTEVEVNWCPMLGTVLSNEEVTNEGLSERGNYPVYKRPLRQWLLRITEYADRLSSDLDLVDWPAGVVEMQRNWIGRSTGAEISFPLDLGPHQEQRRLRIFTTRPDTLFGATFIAVAPNHPEVSEFVTAEQATAVDAFLARQSIMRLARGRDNIVGQDGAFTGTYACHPATGLRLPIWLADYVLREYGTGAIMAVPAHDDRDFSFAKRFDLRIQPVVAPPDAWLRSNAPANLAELNSEQLLFVYVHDASRFASAFVDAGRSINSDLGGICLDGLQTLDAIERVTERLEILGAGSRRLQYKLRDWLFSRQRYWGEPFPVVYSEEGNEVYAVDDLSLPVLLPAMKEFKPQPSEDVDAVPTPPLARATEWMTCSGVILSSGRVHIITDPTSSEVCIGGQTYRIRRFRRDPNTMPNWAGSCWYYLRYFDPHNGKNFVDPSIERYWAGGSHDGRQANGTVDLYVGGTEHAVLHLLYSRFWHKVLYDLDLASTPEPFQKLFNQGMITADAYRDGRGVYVDIHDVSWRADAGRPVPFNTRTGEILTVDPGKMGKRYRNGLPPEEICEMYTTDTFRCYEMYLGPLDQSKPWQTEPIIGMFRFLDNVWKLATHADRKNCPTGSVDSELEHLVHKTIKGVTEDIRALRMNTALSKLIVFYNAVVRRPPIATHHVRILCTLLAPFAPHLAEQLFQDHLGLPYNVRWAANMAWPTYDSALAADTELNVPVQVNGRKRDEVTVPIDIDDATLQGLAMRRPNIQKYIRAGTVHRIVVVNRAAQKLVNIVVV